MTQLGRFLLLLFFLFAFPVFGKDLKVFKRGRVELVDETELAQPKDYGPDFDEDLRKAAEFGDIYDQQLPTLPRFELHKNGKNMGWTKLPIVTRKMAGWSTPLPKNRGVENEPWPYTTTKQPTTPNPPKMTPPPLEIEGEGPIQIQTLPPQMPEMTTKRNKKPTKVLTLATTPRPIIITSKGPLKSQGSVERIGGKFTTKDTFPLLETSTIPAPSRRPASFERIQKPPPIGQNEQTNALERLRKKLLTLRPTPQRTEVSVKSNSFAIHPSPSNGGEVPFAAAHRQPQQPPPTPGNGGRFSWSRSWSIGPDGRMEIRTWDRLGRNKMGGNGKKMMLGNGGGQFAGRPIKSQSRRQQIYKWTKPVWKGRNE